MNRKLIGVSVLLAIVLAMGGIRLAAITAGQPDGTAHPYVGLLVVYAEVQDADHNVLAALAPVWRCSGSQLSSTVFLTAGHCVGESLEDVTGDGVADIVIPKRGTIFFSPTVGTPLLSQTPDASGDVFPHPQYADFAGFPNTHDVGVVVLDSPVSLGAYGQLAPVGTLDSWSTLPRRGQSLVAVGYGLQLSRPKAVLADLVRMQATEQFAQMRSALTDGFNVQTIDSPRFSPRAASAGLPEPGGTCFGDSGGPQLLPGTDLVVAVTSFGLNNNCSGTGFHHRVDILDSFSFINGFLQ